MKKELSLAILALLTMTLLIAGCPRQGEIGPGQGPYPAPPKEWSQTFGGDMTNRATSVQQTACGGFIIAGDTSSFGAGRRDFWLIKTDDEGNKEWSRTFGGTEWDVAFAVQQTADGGFIIAGSTTSFGAGETDSWLIRTDEEGNKVWSRTFGGPNSEWAISVQQTADRGFIVAGSTMSFGAGETDSWLIRTDEEGNKVWSRTFGGPNSEWATSVQQTACGGFIIAGNTSSFGAGQADFWLVKTDPDGNEQWSRTFGGYWWEGASSVQQTACGGFIIAGSTSSFGAGQADFWLVKTDPDGNEQWSRTFGGPYLDRAYSVQQTACGGFIIAGETQSFGAGCQDFWLVKTDEEGNKEWANTLGGALSDFARSVQQTACGGFIIAGDTSSFGALGTNFRLIKLAPER